jgi:Porin subfamily
MKILKTLLLGTAAGLVAVAGAQAADMPVKAAPVQYVKICSLYGDGFYYIPGTDTCLKMGGYLRVQAEYNMGGGGVVVGDNAGGMLGLGRFTRDLTDDFNYRVRGAISWDVRQQTEYGTLRTYIRFGAENTTPVNPGSGTTFNPFWDRAFIQFAGFTVGRSQSFFDLVTYGGAYSYHNVRVSGDTGASGQNLWAYTAQFGNGFSGTLSVEDPATRKQGTVDVSAPGFFAVNAAALTDNAFTIQAATLNGFRVPDVIANLRVDQQWGFAGISAALHDVSGAYFQTPNSVVNGHPDDKYGWAVAGGAKFNLAGGDAAGFNICYARGAPGFCANNSAFQLYNSNTSVGLAWTSDGVFGTGTQIELTQVWSALAFYEPHLEPALADIVVRWLRQHRLQQQCHLPDPAAPAQPGGRMRPWGRAPRRDRHRAHAAAGQRLQPRLGLLGNRLPHPVEPGAAARYRPRSAVLEAQHGLQRRRYRARERLAPASLRPRRPGGLVRHGPLAAQLLSMIA